MLAAVAFHALPFCSALLFWLSFHPVRAWPLAWFSLIPFFIYTRGIGDLRPSIPLSFASGLACWSALVHWFAFCFPLGPLLYGAFRALSWLAVVLLSPRLRLPFWLSCTTVWVLSDWLFAHMPILPFPWFQPGLSQIEFASFAQAADLGGAFFLGVPMLLFQGLIADALLRPVDRSWRWGAAAFLALFLSMTLYGSLRKEAVPLDPGPRILAVQPNIDPEYAESLWRQDISEEQRTRIRWDIFRKHWIMSAEPLLRERPDFVVWSEDGLRFLVKRSKDGAFYHHGIDYLRRFVRAFSCWIVTGVNFDDAQGDYNSGLAMDPAGNVAGYYHKIYLVPFGEQLPPPKPVSEWFVRTFSVFRSIGDLDAGDGVNVVRVAGHSISMLICYEVVFPHLTRSAANLGARLVVNMSNDAWFRDSAELDELLVHARWRAIESRVGFVRATNTGISAFLNPRGEIEAMLPGKEVEGTLCGRLSLTSAGSLYRLVGEWWVLLFAAAFAFGLRRTPARWRR